MVHLQLAALLLSVASSAARSSAPGARDWPAYAKDVLAELVRIDTTHGRGSTEAARAIAARLKEAGFPETDLALAGPAPESQNLVARYSGSGAGRPLLYVVHLDVVPARAEDWSTPPFALVERDGFLQGRGTSDAKGKAAALVAALVRLRAEGYRPDRDVIVAFTDDEEQGPADTNGVLWLVTHRPDLLGAPSLAVNPDAGGGESRRGGRQLLAVQTSEKIDVSFRLEATDRGGHSSLPHAGNPIYRIATAVARIQALAFPDVLGETTRGYFAAMSTREEGPLARDLAALGRPGAPDRAVVARVSAASDSYAALLHTTCVATEISGGHADNALPQLARATVNCRILPGEKVEGTEAVLRRAVGDDAVRFSRVFEPRPAPASPLSDELLAPLRRVAAELFPGVQIAPELSTGASDSPYLRAAGIPTYGISGLFGDADDVRADGRDERVSEADFRAEVEFTFRFAKALTASTVAVRHAR